MKNALLIIDMQNDFALSTGTLYVPGGETACKNAAAFIKVNKNDIDHISLTADSHYYHHIANPVFWKNVKGEHPSPFTVITSKDIKEGKYQTSYNPLWAYKYVEELEKLGKVLTIWNPHCLVMSKGWLIEETVWEAVNEWSSECAIPYNMAFKGSNLLSEHYSVFKAEVPVPNCPETQINQQLINVLNKYDNVFIIGLAEDYCVKYSIDDINTYAPDLAKKMIILEDCTSPIDKDFNINSDPVYQKSVSLGARIMKSTDVTF